jgi:glycosyltransferase involved in cell wall biosynthesis
MKPLVSVSIITYNQENYIRQTIDSVLEQKTNFDFEICIGNDGSTDRTSLICDEYAEKYNQKVRIFHRDRNNFPKPYIHSGRRNFIETMAACKGKYIALLDGDDYWTDPSKLQKQVEYLEKNEESSSYFSRCKRDQ